MTPPAFAGPSARTWPLRQACRCLRAGGLLAYPTETVYGLGCDPCDPLAVARLLALKGRPMEKGLILIAADLDQLAPWVTLDEALAARLTEPRPRPASWVVPATPAAPPWITGGRDTLAVRLTGHPLARALCRAFGAPLVSTSANRAGHPPARSALQVQLRLGDGIDYLLHGRAGPHRRPSEIIDARSGRRLRA